MIGLNVSLAVLPTACLVVSVNLGAVMMTLLTAANIGWLWVLTCGHQRAWIVKAAAKISGCAAIEVMDLHGNIIRTVACLDQCHSGWAQVFWLSGVGSMRLLNNGVVHPDSESSYLYLWRYLDRELQTEHTLSWNTPDWHEWQKMDHFEKISARIQLQV
jgi:hypothetical protein